LAGLSHRNRCRQVDQAARTRCSALGETGLVEYDSRLFCLLVILVMVVIRLARGGAKQRPFYSVVVTDSRNRRDGRFIERLGFYNPVASGSEQPVRIDAEKVRSWVAKGAQVSPTVQRLLKTGAAAA